MDTQPTQPTSLPSCRNLHELIHPLLSRLRMPHPIRLLFLLFTLRPVNILFSPTRSFVAILTRSPVCIVQSVYPYTTPGSFLLNMPFPLRPRPPTVESPSAGLESKARLYYNSHKH
ncbi:hypothetical protein PIIN_03946 [Serendipita indica DSM 11827]|uniref:Uncharacterized protein n=1 Tax=Serendipita indica (strain DSM 11827) TaxID=1109443 RepID=G4TFA5_SERID|nr:hypothetical protein PIIN_03946 [Serendipita indica DSM 11827]